MSKLEELLARLTLAEYEVKRAGKDRLEYLVQLYRSELLALNQEATL